MTRSRPVESPPALPGQDQRAEQARARREFAKAKQVVLSLRLVFWIGSLAALVSALLWHAMPLDREALGGWYLAITAVLWLQVGLMLAGAVCVLRAPFPWSIVAASLHTLSTAITLLTGGAISIAIYLFLLLAYWAAVGQARRVQRLMQQHPELQIVRQRIAVERQISGGVADVARERRQRERHAAAKGKMRLLLIVAGGVMVLAVGLWWLSRPPAVVGSVRAFAACWQRSDRVGIDGLFELGSGAGDARALREGLLRRGWDASLPAAVLGRTDERAAAATAEFQIGGGVLRAHFVRHPTSHVWLLARVDLPELQAGTAAAGVAAFEQAWAEAGTASLFGLLTEGLSARFGRALTSAFEKRGWTEHRPALGAPQVQERGDGRAQVTFPVDGGDLRIGLEWWHPRWRIESLRLPRDS